MNERERKTMKTKKPSQVAHVKVAEMDFPECKHLLFRLDYWSKHFHKEAEMWAHPDALDQLTDGLSEERFINVTDNFLEVMEKSLLYERDPVKLWRIAIGLQNHKFGFLEQVESLFPEKKTELRCFKARLT
jgi:hypothetical protein